MDQTVVGLIGLGNMGGAIAEGLAPFEDLKIIGFDPDRDRFNRLEAVTQAPDPLAVARDSQYIILAVKPGLIAEAVREISPALNADKCIVSVAAGIRMQQISEACAGSCPVVRVMPNMPALVGQGVFAVCLDDENLLDSKGDFIADLFNRLGNAHILGEKYFDAFTALIGSGPAYVYYFLESLVDAGVTLGLPRKETTEMVSSLLSGSVALLEKQDKSPALLKESICSPAGTTIAGVNELDRNAVKSAFIRAVVKARDRSRELGS